MEELWVGGGPVQELPEESSRQSSAGFVLGLLTLENTMDAAEVKGSSLRTLTARFPLFLTLRVVVFQVDPSQRHEARH